MERREFERITRLEQIQLDGIRAMDKHIEEDRRMLGEIRANIADIYDKLNKIIVKQTRLETIFWLVGSLIVLITPVITSITVAFFFHYQ